MSTRRAVWKKTVDWQGAGSKRRENADVLRKERREQILSSKRLKHEEEDEVDEDAPGATAEEIAAAVLALQKGSADERVEAVRQLRRMLSKSGAPRSQVLAAGVLPVLLGMLSSNHSELQLQSAWCITNLAAGSSEHTRACLDAAPILVTFLASDNTALQEQAAWALGNMAVDSADCRRHLVHAGVVVPLVRLLSSKNAGVQHTAAFATANLLRGPGSCVDELFAAGIAPVLPTLLWSPEERVRMEGCWICVYATAGSDKYMAILQQVAIIPPLLQLLQQSQDSLRMPALRVIGNIASGPDLNVVPLLSDANFMPALLACLRAEHRAVQKEAAYTLSNLAVGPPAHVDALVAAGALPALCSLFVTAAFDIRKEAAMALQNLVGDARHFPALLEVATTQRCERELVAGFLGMLRAPDLDAARVALQFTEMFLSLFPKPRGAQLVEELDGIDALESLQMRELPPEIAWLGKFAGHVVDLHFSDIPEDDEEEQPMEMPAWRLPPASH